MVGEPGVGKSTAMNKLAIDLLSKSLEQATRKKGEILNIPVLLKARDLVEIRDVNELLDKFGPEQGIRNRFKVTALLIDALDEVHGEAREPTLSKALAFAKALECGLIVTSRKIDLIRKETLALDKRELLPLQYGQALTLCNRLVRDEKKLDALKSGLKTIQNQLTMTPLTLLLLVDLVEANKEIPASIALLYDKFFDLALGLDDKKLKGLEMIFNPEVKKNFLEELAYREFFEKSRDSVAKGEFEDFLDDYSAQQQWDKDELRQFVVEIERAGILDIRDEIRFVHTTFLDYFVALRIFNNREEVQNLDAYLTDIYFDDSWHDVVFYYTGLRKSITKGLIDGIIDYKRFEENDIVPHVAKALVGKLLQAAWQSKAEVKVHGLRESQAFCGNIKRLFLDLTKNRQPAVPLIYADLYTLLICEMAYGSRYLWKQERALIEEYLKEASQASISKAIAFLWANRDRIDPDEKNGLNEQLVLAATQAPKGDGADYARNLLLLRALSTEDKALFKNVEKRLSKQQRDSPELFDRLLPSGKKGFRSQKAIEAAKMRKRAITRKKRKKS